VLDERMWASDRIQKRELRKQIGEGSKTSRRRDEEGPSTGKRDLSLVDGDDGREPGVWIKRGGEE